MAERFEIVEKALLAMLEDKKYSTLRDILATMNPSDIASVFTGMEYKEIILMYRLLPKELAADVFVEMDEDTQEYLIKGFSDNELKEMALSNFVHHEFGCMGDCLYRASGTYSCDGAALPSGSFCGRTPYRLLRGIDSSGVHVLFSGFLNIAEEDLYECGQGYSHETCGFSKELAVS